IANYQNVYGGKGNNVLVGDARANVLVGGAGRNLIIGGAGADQITGGGGDNILIGGTTLWDTNPGALQAPMNKVFHTFDSTDHLHDFNIRINHIRDGKGSLVKTGFYLDKKTGKHAASVLADGDADQLTGGVLNWFFTDGLDVINNGNALGINDRKTVV